MAVQSVPSETATQAEVTSTSVGGSATKVSQDPTSSPKSTEQELTSNVTGAGSTTDVLNGVETTGDKAPDDTNLHTSENDASKSCGCAVAKHWRLLWEPLDIGYACRECRQGAIEAYEDEIMRLRALVAEQGGTISIDNEKDKKETEKGEVSLTKIESGKYRQVKRWPPGQVDTQSSVLLVSMDGADFGIRRTTSPSQLPRVSVAGQNVGKGSPDHEAVPFRLVLNDDQLLQSLGIITGEELEWGVTFIRPFKYLLAHESKIRAALAKCDEISLSSTHLNSVAAEQPEQPEQQQSSQVRLFSAPKSGPETLPNVQETQQVVEHLNFSPRLRSLLALLVAFMDQEMSDILTIRKQIADRTAREITFEHVQHLFTPGDFVFTNPDPGSTGSPRRAYKVLSVTGGRPTFSSRSSNRDRRGYRFGSGDERWIGGFEVHSWDHVSHGLLGKAAKMTPVVIDCFYIDFDGTAYGPCSHRFIIPEFHGSRGITSLDVYPAEFDNEYQVSRAELRARGEEFVRLAKGTFKHFTGRTLDDDRLRTSPTDLDCDCIIDQKTALDVRLCNEIGSDRLFFGSGVIKEATEANDAEWFDVFECGRHGCAECTEAYDDSDIDLNKRTEYMNVETLLETVKEPTHEHLELLPCRLFGYALQRREWYAFNLLDCQDPKCLRDPEAAASAFKDLVLPDKHKSTIQALVRHHVRSFNESAVSTTGIDRPSDALNNSFDLIQGKGRGLALLFHGVPGVGKTSTAESVAMQMKRPLLPITCGDLGTDFGQVERRLQNYFELGSRWGCVILLDEADVFMAKRTTGDLERNFLVSVFLRQMEYNAGVLILTTNRIGEFDEAFISRIHMKLHFPKLDQESTMKVWKMNIRRLSEGAAVQLKEEKILAFAEWYWRMNKDTPDRQWNGRQIKNAFQAAVALACFEWENGGKPGLPELKKRHFVTVADTSVRFDDFIDRTFGSAPRPGRKNRGGFANELLRSRVRFDEELEVEGLYDRSATAAQYPSPTPIGRNNNNNNSTSTSTSRRRSVQDDEARLEAEVQRRLAQRDKTANGRHLRVLAEPGTPEHSEEGMIDERRSIFNVDSDEDEDDD